MKKIIITMFIFLNVNSLYAVEPAGYQTESGFLITPQLNTGINYDDNIFNRDTNKVDDVIFDLSPSVNFLLDDGVNQYNFDLNLDSGFHNKSTTDNYVDGNIAFTAHLEPSSQSRWDLSTDYAKITETRGSGLTESNPGFINKPLNYDQQNASVNYEYGALTSKGRVAFNAKYSDRQYNNFPAISQFRNFNSISYGSTFFYSNNSKTDTFIELNRNVIRYDIISTQSRDSNDDHALLGVQWQSTALTTGSIKIGYQNKNFVNSTRENFRGLSWTASIQWQPLTYTQFTFDTSRNAVDPNVVGDYIKQTIYSLGWDHDWSNLLTTQMGFGYNQSDYRGVIRTDKIKSANLSFIYSVTRWLDVSFDSRMNINHSTSANIGYEKHVYGVNFVISL